MTIIIWDKLPDCLLDKIYGYIYFSQPKNLLDDIISYKYTIDHIKHLLYDDVADDCDWYIIWRVMLYYERNSRLHIMHVNIKFKKLKKFIINNSNIMIKYEGGLYWIKKYISKMSKKKRDNFIKELNIK